MNDDKLKQLARETWIKSHNREPSIPADFAEIELIHEVLTQAVETASDPRIYSRCPACQCDTLHVIDKHLVCTWHKCPNPTLIDNLPSMSAQQGGEPWTLETVEMVNWRCKLATGAVITADAG